MLTEGELSMVEDSDRVRELQDRIGDLKAEVLCNLQVDAPIITTNYFILGLRYESAFYSTLTDTKIRTRQSETRWYQWIFEISTSARSFWSVRRRRRHEQIEITILSKNLGGKSNVIITFESICLFVIYLFRDIWILFLSATVNFNYMQLFFLLVRQTKTVYNTFFLASKSMTNFFMYCHTNVIDFF